TTSFTRSPSSTSTLGGFPDVRPGKVPRQPSFVTLRRLRREVQIREIDDPARGRCHVAKAVGHPWWDSKEPGSTLAEHQTHARAFGPRALPNVEQNDQHAIGRRHVPDVRLSRVDVEGLDHARLDLAVVDLTDGEVPERLGASFIRADELGKVPAIVAEALELDELDAVDRLGRRVGL